MKKRLRKKKSLGEFQQVGFEFSAAYKCENWDEFIREFTAVVEENDVYFYGHCCNCGDEHEHEGECDCKADGIEHIEGFVTAGRIDEPVKARREKFLAEITAKLNLTDVQAGEWVDANYEGVQVKIKD